jgi:predicted transposase/invertase (TIGR01784 family)
VQEVLTMNEGLQAFAKQYHFNAGDPAVQQKYFDYQMALWAERDRRETAMAIGRDQGIAIGETQALLKTAKQALQLGLDAAMIAGLTGLSISEIEALRKEMN